MPDCSLRIIAPFIRALVIEKLVSGVFLIVAVAMTSIAGFSRTTVGAENGFSNYSQGAYGDFFVAVPPEPGVYLRSDIYYFSGDVSATTQNGLATLEANGRAIQNYVSALWVSENSVIGDRFAAGVFIPLNYFDGRIDQTTQFGTADVGNDDFGLGDIVAVPASFYWSWDKFHINAYEAFTTPTGNFDADQLVNVGRNYWSFDTVVALSWFDPTQGLELSLAPGLMINTRNPDTDYQTGAEFHVNAMANQFLFENLAVGLHGYYYRQLTKDSGNGAVFGDFKSTSFGLGPALYWRPNVGNKTIHLIAKWQHDFLTTNRFKGDQAIVKIMKKY